MMCSYNADICRICTNNNTNLTDIFSSTSTISSISKAIMECAPISISEIDTLPHTICTVCLDKLENAYNFRMLCIQTDKTLRNNESCRIVKEEQDKKLSIASITEITSVLDDAEIKCEENSYDDFPNNDAISSEGGSVSDNNNDSDSDSDNDNDNDSTFSIDSNELSEKSYDSRKRSKKRRSSKYELYNCPLVPNDEGFFQCDQCEKKYKRKRDLQRHLRSHKEIRCRCDQCGKEFRSYNNLRLHMVIHQSEPRYNCEFCGMTFKQSAPFYRHRTIHLNERPFKCDWCPNEFRLKRFLEDHLRTHTGERPFVCGTCGKTYKRKDHLTVHEQLHTGKRFKCNHCGQAYLTKRSVNIHMLKSCRKLFFT